LKNSGPICEWGGRMVITLAIICAFKAVDSHRGPTMYNYTPWLIIRRPTFPQPDAYRLF